MKKNVLIISFCYLISFQVYGLYKEFDRSYKIDTVLVPQNTPSSVKNIAFQRLSTREIFTKDGPEFSYGQFIQSLHYTNDSKNGDQTLKTNKGSSFQLKWNLSSNTRFQPVMSIGLKKIEYTDKTNMNIFQPSKNLIDMGAGIRYYLGRRWNLLLNINIEQEHFINYSTPDIEKVALSKVHLALQGQFWNAKNWSGEFLLGGYYCASKASADLDVDAGLGYRAVVGIRKWISALSWYRVSGYYIKEGQSVRGNGFSADVNRSSTGINLRIGTSF